MKMTAHYALSFLLEVIEKYLSCGERNMTDEKKIKYLFYVRVALWITALVATIYWIYWSFHIYNMGILDEHEYALMFRPIFIKGLAISLVAVGLSFILRVNSDRIKDKR